MPTVKSYAAPNTLASASRRRLAALVAIPCIALAAGVGGVYAAAPDPEPVTIAACVQYSPYMSCMT